MFARIQLSSIIRTTTLTFTADQHEPAKLRSMTGKYLDADKLVPEESLPLTSPSPESSGKQEVGCPKSWFGRMQKRSNFLLPILLLSIALGSLILTFMLWASYQQKPTVYEVYEDTFEYASFLPSRNKSTPSALAQRQNTTPAASPKILCFVLTIDYANAFKMKAVNETWAKRCDKLLFVERGQSEQIEELPGNKLAVPIREESRDFLWRKIILAILHIYSKYLDHFDWFLKADDDSYVIMGALREFLAKKSSPEQPIYFGHKFKPYVRQGYMSGGSGYVLSRRALELLVDRGFMNYPEQCHMTSGTADDVEIGICLELSGVEAGDTRDSKGRETFLPLSIEFLKNKTESLTPNNWYWDWEFYNESLSNCCSDEPISLHYIPPEIMYLIDWLLYDVKKVSNPSGASNSSASK